MLQDNPRSSLGHRDDMAQTETSSTRRHEIKLERSFYVLLLKRLPSNVWLSP